MSEFQNISQLILFLEFFYNENIKNGLTIFDKQVIRRIKVDLITSLKKQNLYNVFLKTNINKNIQTYDISTPLSGPPELQLIFDEAHETLPSLFMEPVLVSDKLLSESERSNNKRVKESIDKINLLIAKKRETSTLDIEAIHKRYKWLLNRQKYRVSINLENIVIPSELLNLLILIKQDFSFLSISELMVAQRLTSIYSVHPYSSFPENIIDAESNHLYIDISSLNDMVISYTLQRLFDMLVIKVSDLLKQESKNLNLEIHLNTTKINLKWKVKEND